jgi:hypothetical protein
VPATAVRGMLVVQVRNGNMPLSPGNLREIEPSRSPELRQPLPRDRDHPPRDDPWCPVVRRMGAQKNPTRTQLHGGAAIAGKSNCPSRATHTCRLLSSGFDVKGNNFTSLKIDPISDRLGFFSALHLPHYIFEKPAKQILNRLFLRRLWDLGPGARQGGYDATMPPQAAARARRARGHRE